jgi:hypothetical protein
LLSFTAAAKNYFMLEINPLVVIIKDLSERTEVLRGYL